MLTDSGWIEVQNKATYVNVPYLLEPDKNFDPMKMAAAYVFPDLPDKSVSSYIRIFLVGNLIESEKKSKEVASYIDPTLNP